MTDLLCLENCDYHVLAPWLFCGLSEHPVRLSQSHVREPAARCLAPELQPISHRDGPNAASVENIRDGPQRRRSGSLRLADHRHDIGGKLIGLGLYAVYTRGLRFGDA